MERTVLSNESLSDCVLVVDNDAGFANLLAASLRRQGLPIQVATDGAEGMEIIRRDRPAAVLLDLLMPGIDGFQVAEFCKKESPDTKLIVMSADLNAMRTASQRLDHIHRIIDKPTPVGMLAKFLRDILDGEAPTA